MIYILFFVYDQIYAIIYLSFCFKIYLGSYVELDCRIIWLVYKLEALYNKINLYKTVVFFLSQIKDSAHFASTHETLSRIL